MFYVREEQNFEISYGRVSCYRLLKSGAWKHHAAVAVRTFETFAAAPVRGPSDNARVMYSDHYWIDTSRPLQFNRT